VAVDLVVLAEGRTDLIDQLLVHSRIAAKVVGGSRHKGCGGFGAGNTGKVQYERNNGVCLE
jgi:hypothetical protein